MRLFRAAKKTPQDEIVLDSKFVQETQQRREELVGFKLADFDVRNTLGTGSFGRVRLCVHKAKGKVYAIKMLSKALVLRTKQLEHITAEKDILMHISHPFIINIYGIAQDPKYLYFALEYSIGGELFTHLRRATRFSNDTARFYAASVVLIFEYLHNRNIVYRDLKPENLLLDHAGRLKMCDFGFAKTVEPGSNTWTLCGTPEYLAPEIILNKGHGKAVDWWSLGILIYEMLAGFPPFYHDDRMQLYQLILKGNIKWQRHFKPGAKELIASLLQEDLSQRLGNLKDGAKDIRRNEWFLKIDFQQLALGKLEGPIKITAKGPDDASNFDAYDDNEGPDVGVKEVTEEQQKLFENFCSVPVLSPMGSPREGDGRATTPKGNKKTLSLAGSFKKLMTSNAT